QAERSIVLGHAYIADTRKSRAREAVEVLQSQRRSELTGAVSPEVEAYDLVAILDSRSVCDHARFDEFIGFAGRVRLLDRGTRVWRGNSLAEDHRAPRTLCALPSFVAVHRVVATADRGDFAAPDLAQLGRERVHERQRRTRRLVAAIEHRMHRDFAHALARR